MCVCHQSRTNNANNKYEHPNKDGMRSLSECATAAIK